MHPLLTHQLSLARQDDLQREAATVRSTKIANGEFPTNIRWIRRFVRVDDTRCATEATTW